jgi:hypothetical protein
MQNNLEVTVIEAIFEEVLCDLDHQGQEEWPDDWEDKVSSSLDLLREAYNKLTIENRAVIDYSQLSAQAAYVFAYAIGRAEFTYQLLKRHRAALGEPIFSGAVARITSLGGGPGSEIAGIVKYLLDPENGEGVKSIKYRVFDKDGEWGYVCQNLIDRLNEHFPLDLEFIKFDLCDSKASKISLEGDDLLILSFIISELCAISERNKVAENLRNLYKTMDNKARIFYNDSNAASFYYFFNESKKFVKGLGSISQKSEIKDNIVINSMQFGPTYKDFMDTFDATPHLNSDALSKFLVRCLQ